METSKAHNTVHHRPNIIRVSALFASLVLFVGCANKDCCQDNQSGGGGTQPTTPPDLTGNWYITVTSSVDSSTAYLVGSVVDTQQQVAASLWQASGADNQSCTAGYLWIFSGMQSGTNISLSTTAADSSGNGATITAVTSSTSDGSSLSGTYSISGGCSNGDRGTLIGVRVPSLTGSWTGTIDGNNAETVSASITQASSAGPPIVNYGVTVNGDTFALTGTWQFTGNQCLGEFSGTTPASLSSSLQGNEVGVTLLSNGNELAIGGLVSDPSTADNMSLSYSIHSGDACNGQVGTLVLSR